MKKLLLAVMLLSLFSVVPAFAFNNPFNNPGPWEKVEQTQQEKCYERLRKHQSQKRDRERERQEYQDNNRNIDMFGREIKKNTGMF